MGRRRSEEDHLMATNILMPALSPTMTEGTLARWLKKEGDTVTAGDVIAEIETDKATMEVEAVDEGVLGKILVADGTAGVQVNAPIAILVEAGEAVPSDVPPKGVPAPAAAATADSAPKPSAAGPSMAASQVPGQVTNGHDKGERVFASPLARRMAKQAGIALDGIRGSGPNGRIVKADIEAAQAGGGAAKAPAPQAAAAPSVPAPTPAPAPTARPVVIAGKHTLIPNTNMRKVIARRLTEAKQTIPHFYVTADVEIDALMKLRADLNAKSPKEGAAAFKLSVNDLVIKAAAAALRRVPAANASWTDEGIAMYDDVDISIAVATEGGLITPIIRRADQKGVATISNEMKDLAGRARAGKLKPEEFQGGGFSISNLGMYGVKSFSAIINPPQGGILAVGAGEPRPVVRDGAIVAATVMTCTLSVDHRVIDGAIAAEWMAAFKSIVQDPLSLML
jgi:pyruvate dehydrogenase E2 component (dihydrolipoamide acetyltransferase)